MKTYASPQAMRLGGLSAALAGLLWLAYFYSGEITASLPSPALDWPVSWPKDFLPLSLMGLLTLSVLAYWKRNLWWEAAVFLALVVGKLMWSLRMAGKTGNSWLIPAVIGLMVCSAVQALKRRRPRLKP